MSEPQLITDIRAGLLDDLLNELEDAIQARRRNRTRNDFKVGARVKFNRLVSPKYLVGMEATVVGRKTTRVVVDMDKPTGRFGSGKGITCPVSILDPVRP